MTILTPNAIEIYTERAGLFGAPPIADAKSFTAHLGKRDGTDALKMLKTIPLDDITSIELEMSAEPRARIGVGEGGSVLLCFADDTGAMLWRHHMRRAMWGVGQAMWTDASLGELLVR